MNEIDLAWLAGIWDGEGSISLFKVKERNAGEKIKIFVNVINADIAIINKVQQVLVDMGLSFHMMERKPKSIKHNTTWTLSSANMNQIKLFLEKILPYLQSKKKFSGEIVLRYINQRLAKLKPRQFNGTTPYDSVDWSYVDKIEHPRSSETTRETTI